MKKTLLSLLIAVFFITLAFGQDLITTKNGDEINAKVLEITPQDIKYNTADKAGILQSMPIEQVFMIKYENGKKDIFTEQAQALPGGPSLNQAPVASPVFRDAPAYQPANSGTGENLYVKGHSDASMYYDNYKTAGTITLVSTLVFAPIGLVAAIGTSATAPTRSNLGYPDANLFAQPEYARGYTSKAKKIKSGKVWKNFGIGAGVLVVLNIIIASGR